MLKSSIEARRGSTRRDSTLMPWNPIAESGGMNLDGTAAIKSERKHIGAGRSLLGGTDGDFDSRSKLSNASVTADEAEVYPQNRMLQDSTGRLLYIGDSATLSYLQWIRMIVENISGPSDFTVDPRRHMIMENAISLPQDLRPTGILPDQRTANVLISSFFTNTTGFIEVFNKHAFLKSVDECYKDPPAVTPSLLCLMYLVFAIGLVMAAPFPGSDESAVFDKLRSERASRAELFFRSARSLAHPVSGFEDADFWSIQALLLMSLYMLAVSKRNASYAYYGMAIRSAFALGLHREESLEVFQLEERLVRKSLWKTLFILDRFLSACLGRPTAISEEDCSNSAFETPETATTSPVGMCTEATHSAALNAAFKSLAGSNSKPSRPSHKMENFAQTCVEASQHILVLAQAVLDDKYLPQCNPFVIHCVFAAALIVLSNEFASLYHNPDARVSINSAISILRFCSQNDKQAERVSYIVESFDKANEQRTSKRLYLPGRKIPILSTLSQNRGLDVMCHFFHLGQREALTTTTASKFKEETVLVAAVPPPTTSIPMMPQQPSPDGSVSLSSGMTTTAGMAPGVNTLSGGDSEFDLDSLWDGWNNGSNAAAAMHHHPTNAFGSYNLGPSHIHPVGPSVMYHPSEFR
ncbi:hypothetical protein EKO27_g880 [Xylaria grammica]|uniref:Xylanolytic transcriptional activator regulatory domain-containing protein n=1 Tax=Xylaria grammica TaxID=363999 RepID=A0A439DIK6_9PEZI|nr:hypothetical protein EKO27_g880 [Xylaria grammica]